MSQLGTVKDDSAGPSAEAETRGVTREDDMARNRSKKSSEAATVERPTRATVNKREAVRQALDELGPKARPPQIQQFVRERFGVEMAPNHISSYKSSILKMAAQKKKGDVAEGAPAEESAGHGISLADIKTIKEMAARIGVRRLRELVELLYE